MSIGIVEKCLILEKVNLDSMSLSYLKKTSDKKRNLFIFKKCHRRFDAVFIFNTIFLYITPLQTTLFRLSILEGFTFI